MILNEAVTLLGYKVDERELARYQRQLRQQEAEALKLLNQREQRHFKAEQAKLKEAERTAREQARIAARTARNQERENAKALRDYERMLSAQIRAADRAARQQERIAAKAARNAEKERQKALSFVRGGIGGGLGMGAGMIGGALGVGSLMAGARSTFDTGVERENMLTGLKNLRGMNEQLARAKFKELQQFNLKTPFTLDQITTSYIRLKNLGLDASEQAMKAYGGIAASIPGKKITDFVEAVADGVMGESERLKEFGIKMKVEGDKAAITFRNQTIKVNRDAKSIEKALMDIGTKNFANSMEDLAKTTGGQVSNMQDAFDDLKWTIWEGGMKQAFRQLVGETTKLLKQWTPLAREFAIFAKLNLPTITRGLADGLKLVGVALGVLIAKTVGQSYLTMLKNIGLLSASFKTLGASAFFAESGLAALAKGGVLITLAAILGDFIYYLNTGDSLLVRFTERWPKLSSAIKDGYYWNKVFIEAVTIGFQKIWIKINDVYQKTKIWFDYIKGEIGNPVLLKFLGGFTQFNPVTNAVGNLLGGFNAPSAGAGGGTPNAGNPLTNSGILGPGVAKNQKLGQSLAQLAPSIREVEKYCLRAVWRIQNAALGGTSKIEGAAAYQAADFLARDQRFKEVKFTPEMYKKMMQGDPQLKALMQGATVIYNRQSGFSPTAGHAEIWDTYKQKSFYGLGATSMQRSDKMINNARFFVPVQKQTMPAPNNSSFQTSSADIGITQNFYGPADPKRVGSASRDGTQTALNRAQLTAPKAVNGFA